MKFSEIIDDIQRSINTLQERLDELKEIDYATTRDELLTRHEAARLMGKSLRQLDRDCIRFGIPKEYVNGGIRIRKKYILKHMGLLPPEECVDMDFTRMR